MVALTDASESYTIETDYYKVVIPKNGQHGSGIINQLYVKKLDTNWSADLTLATKTTDMGFGFLEGVDPATVNSSGGFYSTATVSLIKNTEDMVIINAVKTTAYAAFSHIWTFTGGQYFRCRSYIYIIPETPYLTNQYQICWMVNNSLAKSFTGLNTVNGSETFFRTKVQSMFFQGQESFPWVNWAYTTEGVSVGLVFTDIQPYGCFAETGDWASGSNFEYQMDFNYGGGLFGNPVKAGMRRAIDIDYFVSQLATNAEISTHASSTWDSAIKVNKYINNDLAAASIMNPIGQNAGVGSALIHTPFFLCRQNTNTTIGTPVATQQAVSIYAPLFASPTSKVFGTNSTAGIPIAEALVYNINADDDSTTYQYSSVTDADATNTSDSSSLVHTASDSSGNITYTSTFYGSSNSDKLLITANAQNADDSSVLRDIWAELSTVFRNITVESQVATPTNQIVQTLTNNDGKWSYLAFGPYKTMVIYANANEVVAPVSVNFSDMVPGRTYSVRGYFLENTGATYTIKYSYDGTNYTDLTVPMVATQTIGMIQMDDYVATGENLSVYFDDDGATGGTAQWCGFQMVEISPKIYTIDDGYYDLSWQDGANGVVGVGIKVNSSVDILNTGDALKVYLLKNASQQSLTTFDYSAEIELHPHLGYYDSVEDFTAYSTKTRVPVGWALSNRTGGSSMSMGLGLGL